MARKKIEDKEENHESFQAGYIIVLLTFLKHPSYYDISYDASRRYLKHVSK